MKTLEVRTQAELDAAIKLPDTLIDIVAGALRLVTTGVQAPILRVRAGVSLSVEARESSQPRVEAWGSSQPRVEARESSQPRVEAWGSSQPRVVAWESSQPRVVARGSSQPRVVAWGSSQPRVEAWGSSQPRVEAWESSQPRVVAWGSSQPRVEAWESSQPRVEASGYVQLSLLGRIVAKVSAKVAVLIRGAAEVTGGKQTRVRLATARDWCDYYGLPVSKGRVTLYKALGADLRSRYNGGVHYVPGTSVVAADWDGGVRECGGGLHFSPSVSAAMLFAPNATRFVAVSVALKDMRGPKDSDESLNKTKARACRVLHEVNRDGERIEAKAAKPQEVTA